MGSKWAFEPTTNIMWTYRVTHIEWVRNQPLGLKLVFKPKGSLCRLIHFFSQLREAVRGFRETQPGASTLVSLGFEEGSFVWMVVEGGAIYCAFQFDKEGLTHTRRYGTRIFQRQ